MLRRWLSVALSLAFAGGLGVVACGNTANDVGACQQLESARCVRAQGCGIDLGFPLHSGSSAQDAVTACQMYYRDECLHGLVTPATVTSAEVSSCLKAIQTGSCETVVSPQSNVACAWLIPPDAGAEAGADATTDSAADSTTSADVVVVVTVDAGVDAYDAGTCDLSCESQCVSDPNCIAACGC
jgi:hypothetical protein